MGEAKRKVETKAKIPAVETAAAQRWLVGVSPRERWALLVLLANNKHRPKGFIEQGSLFRARSAFGIDVILEVTQKHHAVRGSRAIDREERAHDLTVENIEYLLKRNELTETTTEEAVTLWSILDRCVAAQSGRYVAPEDMPPFVNDAEEWTPLPKDPLQITCKHCKQESRDQEWKCPSCGQPEGEQSEEESPEE